MSLRQKTPALARRSNKTSLRNIEYRFKDTGYKWNQINYFTKYKKSEERFIVVLCSKSRPSDFLIVYYVWQVPLITIQNFMRPSLQETTRNSFFCEAIGVLLSTFISSLILRFNMARINHSGVDLKNMAFVPIHILALN